MHTIIKHSAIILGLLFSLVMIQAQEGVKFFKGSWEETLSEAKKQKKLVFVDAYAVWCGPCKAMTRNTFPNAKVGEFFNEHFVSYKFDMEKGEGPAFASKYGVNAYPTLFFINYKGKVVHKTLGYKSPKDLLTEGRKAIDPKINEDLISLEYESGSSDPEVLYHYALNLYEQKKDYREAAQKYFATQTTKELISRRNWGAIDKFTNQLESPEFQFLLKKQKKFIKRHGLQPVLDKIYSVLKKYTVESALTGNPAKYNAAQAAAEKYLKKDKGLSVARLKMTYTEGTKDWEAYADAANQYFDSYIVTRTRDLHRAADNFYKHIDDPAHLEKALEWSRQSIALENEHYNNHTHAALLFKTGKYNEALRYANKAVQIAELKDQDTRKTKKLMRQIQARMER